MVTPPLADGLLRAAPQHMSEPLRIDISGKTIIRILAVLIAVWLWLQVWEWVLLLVVASFLAVGLDPLVTWLDAHGLRRRFCRPPDHPHHRRRRRGVRVSRRLSPQRAGGAAERPLRRRARSEAVARMPPRLLELMPSSVEGGQKLGAYLLSLGQSLMNGLLSLGVALVLTVYLLLDGRRTYEWLVAFAPGGAPAARPPDRDGSADRHPGLRTRQHGDVRAGRRLCLRRDAPAGRAGRAAARRSSPRSSTCCR